MIGNLICTFRRILRTLLILVLGIMTAVINVAIFYRYVLDDPLTWTDEVARIMLVSLTFLGAALLSSYNDGNINLDLIQSVLKRTGGVVVRIIAILIEILAVAVITVGGYILVKSSGVSVTPALSIPTSYLYAVILIYGITSLFFAALRLIGVLNENLVQQ